MSDTEKISYVIPGIFIIIALIGIILFGVFIYKKASNNGATFFQMFAGKKLGELCTSDAMCGTNKCVNNFCVY